MGGKGGGAELNEDVEEAAQRLLGIGEAQFELGFPLLEAGAQNAESILAGGVGNFGPAIRNQLELARGAQSQGLTQFREDLTRAGITGTAFEDAMGQARLGAEQQVASVPDEFLRPTLETAASQAFGQVPQGLQGIASAGQAGAAGALPGHQSSPWLGALGGAASGAMIGSQIYPGWGTLIGGVAGGLAGGLLNK